MKDFAGSQKVFAGGGILSFSCARAWHLNIWVILEYSAFYC